MNTFKYVPGELKYIGHGNNFSNNIYIYIYIGLMLCLLCLCFSYVNYNLMKYMDKHKVKPDNKAFHLVREHGHFLFIITCSWNFFNYRTTGNCRKSEGLSTELRLNSFCL